MSDTANAAVVEAQPTEATPFIFDRDKAMDALKGVQEAAMRMAVAGNTFKNRRSGYMESFVSFVYTLVPRVKFNEYRRLLKEGEQPADFLVPDEVIAFLRDQKLRLPTFNSPSPFLTMFQHFHMSAKLERKWISQDDYNVSMAHAAKIEEYHLTGKTDAAEGMEVSRYARQILACIDMGEKLEDGTPTLEAPYAKMNRIYTEWQKNNPSIATRLITNKGGSNGGTTTRQKKNPETNKPADAVSNNPSSFIDKVLNARDPYAKADTAKPETKEDDAKPETTKDALDGVKQTTVDALTDDEQVALLRRQLEAATRDIENMKAAQKKADDEAFAKADAEKVAKEQLELSGTDSVVEGRVIIETVFKTDDARELAFINGLDDTGTMTVSYRREGQKVVFYLT